LLRAYLTSAGKQAAGNLVALIVLTGLTQLAGLGSLLLLTNGLGPAGFGVFMFALTLQPYLYLIGSLGMPLVLFREGVKQPGQLDQITTTYLTVGLAASLAVEAVTGVVACLTATSGVEQSLICLIAAGNVATCLALSPLFDVHHRQPLVAAISLAAETGALLAVFLLLRTGNLGLVALGVVFAAKWWFISIAQIVVYNVAIRRVRLAFSRTWLRRLLRSSIPMGCSTLIAGLPAYAGVFFVRFFHGDAEAGVFGIASQAAIAYLLFSYLAIRILQPHIAGRYGLERAFLAKLILFASTFLALLYVGGLAAGIGVVLFVLAPQYQPALTPMAILLAAALLLSVGVLASSYLVVLHRERTVLLAHSAAAVVYVSAAFLLTPSFSNLGAATAATLAAACGTFWMVAAVRTALPAPANVAQSA
jgi:O-antigen/teichoic acid export membrane protein